MTTRASGDIRLNSLDALRGLAAIGVVFWHWQHFFVTASGLPDSFDPSDQPFYWIFKLFYRHGALAVDLFFSLSGFIFFWLYAERISSRQLKPAHFFLLRLSRLYPLHLATFLFVALGQLLYEKIAGSGFVYPYQDFRHFVLNLFLLPSIGLERGPSYNSPVWSVSVEAILYVVFFICCYFRLNRMLLLSAMAVVGFYVVDRFYSPLGRGVGSFFLGGCVFGVYRIILAHEKCKQITLVVALAACILWVGVLIEVYAGFLSAWLGFVLRIGVRFAVLILFPATILSLALLDCIRPRRTKLLSMLGEISYSSYLLHFPLQLVFAILMKMIGCQSSIFNSGILMVVYFSILLPLSLASFRYYEVPMQRYIRSIMGRPKRGGADMSAVEVLPEYPRNG